MDHARFGITDQAFIIRHRDHGPPCPDLDHFHAERLRVRDRFDELSRQKLLAGLLFVRHVLAPVILRPTSHLPNWLQVLYLQLRIIRNTEFM